MAELCRCCCSCCCASAPPPAAARRTRPALSGFGMSGSITVRRLGSAVTGALVPGAHKDGGLAALAAVIAGAARALGVAGQ